MTNDIKISVYEVVGGHLCVASSDGQRVYERLAAVLEANHTVSLSFLNVEILTSAFLNAAIGQLYGKFSSAKIRASIKLEDMQQDDMHLLKRVVDNAKLYFKDPATYELAEQKARES